MSKLAKIDLDKLTVEELQVVNEKSQQLIEQKQHQRLFDAYLKFEQIAKDNNSSIDEILQAGEQLEKERSIRYRNPNNSSETWTGRGRKPKWLIEAINNGASLEDFEV